MKLESDLLIVNHVKHYILHEAAEKLRLTNKTNDQKIRDQNLSTPHLKQPKMFQVPHVDTLNNKGFFKVKLTNFSSHTKQTLNFVKKNLGNSGKTKVSITYQDYKKKHENNSCFTTYKPFYVRLGSSLSKGSI